MKIGQAKAPSGVSLHFEKHKGGSGLNGLQRHNERVPGQKHSNKNIDDERTADNVFLHKANGPFTQVTSDIIEQNRKNGLKGVRKDAVRMVEATVQLSGRILEMPEEQQEQVLRDSYEWLKQEFGEENVVSAVIHKDETTMHLHFDFVPIEDGSLSAKKVISKKKLFGYQRDFLEMLQEEHPNANFERGEQAFAGLKQKDFEKLQELKAEQEKELQDWQDELYDTEDTLDAREDELNERKEQIEAEAKYRQKELDERERNLNEREANLELLEAQIYQKHANASEELKKRSERLVERESGLSERESKIHEAEAMIEERVKSIKAKESNYSERVAKYNKVVNNFNTSVEKFKESKKQFSQDKEQLEKDKIAIEQKRSKLHIREEAVTKDEIANKKENERLSEWDNLLNTRELALSRLFEHMQTWLDEKSQKALKVFESIKERLPKARKIKNDQKQIDAVNLLDGIAQLRKDQSDESFNWQIRKKNESFDLNFDVLSVDEKNNGEQL